MPEPYIKIEYGRDLAVEKLNKLGNYTAVVADPPWSSFSTKIRNLPKETIFPKNVDEQYLQSLLDVYFNKIGDNELIVGMGGGLAIDAGKYLSWKLDRPYMRIPSIISVDAFLTREVGVRNKNRVRYIGRSEPNNVVIDYELIRSAPPVLNFAGTCDVLSICTALGDWKIAHEVYGDKFDQDIYDRAYDLAKDMLSNPNDLRELNDAGIKYLVECLKEECYICEEWGNARPEEGGEHHLAYCVERISPKQYLHGSLVGLNILVVLKLQGSYAAFSVDEVKEYFDQIGHEYTPQQIGIAPKTYKSALLKIQDYVREENLEKGLWYTDNPFRLHTIDEITDWCFSLK